MNKNTVPEAIVNTGNIKSGRNCLILLFLCPILIIIKDSNCDNIKYSNLHIKAIIINKWTSFLYVLVRTPVIDDKKKIVIISVENISVSKIILCMAAFLRETLKQIKEYATFMAKKTDKFIISFSKRLKIKELGMKSNNPIKIVTLIFFFLS